MIRVVPVDEKCWRLSQESGTIPSEDMARNFIIGDIHAMYDRLISTLSSAGFRPEEDNLYAVGDFCDRGPNPVEVLDYLMSLPHFFPVVGNHDMWLYEYLCGNGPAPIWLDPRNGGKTTYDILTDLDPDKKAQIRDWFGSFPFIRAVGNFTILHAGPPCTVADGDTLIRLTEGLTLADAFKEKQETGSYSPLIHGIVWDRDYIRSAIGWEKLAGTSEEENLCRKPFDTDKRIICGHTPLEKVFRSDRYHSTCIDTGSFDPDGCITVMDMESSDF